MVTAAHQTKNFAKAAEFVVRELQSFINSYANNLFKEYYMAYLRVNWFGDDLTVSIWEHGHAVVSVSAHFEVVFDYAITTGNKLLPMLMDLACAQYRAMRLG